MYEQYNDKCWSEKPEPEPGTVEGQSWSDKPTSTRLQTGRHRTMTWYI